MKRLSFILMFLSLATVQHVHAQYYSVNYDTRTVAAMAAAFGTETVAESQFDIDDLERQKDYVVRIAELSGQAERSYRIAYFTTAAQSGRYAGMALQSEYCLLYTSPSPRD